ncbi:cell envelope biogenesis protein OmpA [Hymenobacter qilianensis]|uniref:Cell envelope biogenesis protein OmpA n=2 Tax=Hymenobacter qilianensis TaxID=1385715 RepID=A0ACB5PNL5_9BACT|nr:OmpA family protein [Hymenobacter qilianensis]QNP53406.1 PD40 domain-containing protein [Hymenobacter qilianensis]GGF56800.1 cell envelope biogenesis protein OmpA [Hymenobacter qilianensis]
MKNSIIVWAAAGSVAALGLSGCATSESGTKADKRFARGEYETAIALYKAQAERGKNAPQSNFRVGESYRLSNRIEQAELYYKMAVGAGLKNADAGFYYGLALKANGKYDEAIAQFDDYVKLGTNRALAARAEIEAKNTRLSKELLALKTRDEIQPLDQINSESADFSATMIPDTKEIVFASGRDGKKYLGNGEGFNDLYAIRFEDAEKMTGGTVRKLEPIFNTEGTHEASATYSPDGKMVVFARSNSGKKKGYLSVDLWASYYRSGAWTEPALININDRTTDDFSPVFSPDGETLYFASGRKGGEGGTDLYKATIAANGRFAPAENLGPEINTPGNESFPAVAPDGTLFFSSDGHPGIGKLDVFVVDKGKVRNLGAPFNSSGDDFAPYFTAQNVGVFSSNRAGGKGSDDLYRFRRNTTKLVNFFVDGTVLERDAKTGTTKPVASENVELFANGNRKLLEVTTDAEGKFSFKLDSATTYALVADRPGYFTARTSVTTVGKMPAQDQLPDLVNDIRLPATLTLNKIVKNVAIVVENIFYDYNKADIRPDAAIELDKLVETLNDNPKITIELSSHTDSRGKDAYNASLSQRRAQSAVDYIISKGIAKERITAKGYGETQPVVRNAKTEEQHQRNRRTEFKVTRIEE